jgi:hypothetical protein
MRVRTDTGDSELDVMMCFRECSNKPSIKNYYFFPEVQVALRYTREIAFLQIVAHIEKTQSKKHISFYGFCE